MAVGLGEKRKLDLERVRRASGTVARTAIRNKLATVLNDLIICLSTANFLSPAGAPLPVIDSTGAPIATAPGVNRKSLQTIQGEINNILSSYHFIEKNGQPNK